MLFIKRKNIARFEKVSYKEFERSFLDLYFDEEWNLKNMVYPSCFMAMPYTDEENRRDDVRNKIKRIYDRITIPEAKTSGSAGHDITIPFDIELFPLFSTPTVNTLLCTVIVPTGIRVYIKKGWVLQCFPRSGWGIRGLKIENTVPIIDQDYYYSENEGQIFLKLTNESKTGERFKFLGGDTRMVQGLFTIYGTAGAPSKVIRNGGFNSTSTDGSTLFNK